MRRFVSFGVVIGTIVLGTNLLCFIVLKKHGVIGFVSLIFEYCLSITSVSNKAI